MIKVYKIDFIDQLVIYAIDLFTTVEWSMDDNIQDLDKKYQIRTFISNAINIDINILSSFKTFNDLIDYLNDYIKDDIIVIDDSDILFNKLKEFSIKI